MPGLPESTLNLAAEAIHRGEKTAAIATSLSISEHQVHRIKTNLKKFGTTRPPLSGKPAGRRRKIDDELEAHVREFIRYHPTAMLKEVCRYINEEFGTNLHASTLSRARKRIEAERLKVGL